jgi:FLVCR family MFS transporter 7
MTLETRQNGQELAILERHQSSNESQGALTEEEIHLTKSFNMENSDSTDGPSNAKKPEIVVEVLDTEAGLQHYRIYKRRWLGILCLALLNICTSWGWLSFAAISSYTADYFNLATESPVNWLSTAILFSYVVISPLVWYTLVKKNIRWALIICSGLAIIGNWIRYAGTAKKKFGVVMFGQILIGFAQPFALSSPAYYTDIWFTSSSRVSANAIASLANPLGGAIAQLVGPAIVTESSQLPTFVLVTAIVTSVCGLSSAIVPIKPQLPPCPSSEIVKLPVKESFKALFGSWRFIAVFTMFSIYVGFFNAFSTYINQIMEPFGYSSDEAGIAGAILIVCGIVFAAVTSPLVDKFHRYTLLIKIQVPLIAGCYIAAIFMSTESQQLVGPYFVCALLGAISFSLLPIFLEWVQEQTSPADPAISSSMLWIGGQLFGAVFIIIMNALKYPSNEGNPPGNMRRALIFEAVIACLGVLPVWTLRKPSTNVRIVLDTA